MPSAPSSNPSVPKFDAYAQEYGQLHEASVAASGEPTSYFADYKLTCLKRRGLMRGPLLDFGCGIGTLTRGLIAQLDDVHGYDPSPKSIEVASTNAPGATYHQDITSIPEARFQVAVLSGVLHHIPPADRLGVVCALRSKLVSGGKVVIFEHNPLNPLTRKAVRDCPFDDDAILLYPWQAKSTLRAAGLTNVELDFIVFFPRALAKLRWLEPRLHWLGLGAQMLVVGAVP